MLDCPSPDDMGRYLRSELPGAAEDAFLDHLTHCAGCRERLEAMAGRQPARDFASTWSDLPRADSAERTSFVLQLPERAPGQQASGPKPIGPRRQVVPNEVPTQIGQYRVVRELGRGGMGVVYLARQEGLNRDVALKVLNAGPHSDPEDLLRFRAEAETAAALRHPNIVQVYEVGEQDGVAYLAMEYVPGGTLGDWLDGKPQDPFAAAGLVSTLAQAMQHAHDRGVVHRDLKPGNVLLEGPMPGEGDDGKPGSSTLKLYTPPTRRRARRARKRRGMRNPKLTDFGLARRMNHGQRLTLTGVALGTPSYMAPEQAMGRDDLIGPATDVYALGVILYEMLTGRPPFSGATPLATMQQVCEQEPVSPRRLQPETPRDLETICLKCLEKEPRKRYASAAGLSEDLARFLAGESIAARPTAFWERAWKWARRRPTVAGLAGAVAVVLLLGVTLVTSEWLRANREWERAENEAARAKSALREADERRKQAEQAEADLAFNQSLSLCEQGDVDRGLLWLTRSLDRAGRADAEHLERSIRVNLAAWARQLPRPTRAFRHGAPVRAVAVAPGGERFASAGYDGRVRIWDLVTGAEEPPALEHPLPYLVAGDPHLRDVAWSRDGQLIATGHTDGKFRVWDVAHHRLAYPPLALPVQEAWKVRFGPRDELLYGIGGDGMLRAWDARTGAPSGEPMTHSHEVRSGYFTFALHPGGHAAVTAGLDRRLRAWDLRSRRPVGEPIEFGSLVECVEYRPDGMLVLVGTRDGTLHAWDPARGRLSDLPTQGGSVVAIAFSHDGRSFATSTRGGQVHLWDAETLLEIAPVHRGDCGATALGFAPDGRLVVGDDDGTLTVYAVPQSPALGPPIRHTSPTGGEVHTVAFGHDGRTLLSGSTQSTRFFDAQTGAPAGDPLRLGKVAYVAALSADGTRVAIGGWRGAVGLFDADTGARQFFDDRELGDSVRTMALSPDGRRWFTYSEPGTAWLRKTGPRIWDLTTDPPRPRPFLTGLRTAVRSAAFSPDGRTLVLGCQDGKARFWDVAGDKQVGPELKHAGAVGAVAYSHDGALVLTGSRDGTARLWDARTGEPKLEPLRHRGEVRAVAFGPHGKLLLTGGNDGTARFWDPAFGRPLGPPLRHTSAVQSVAFSPDGSAVVTGTHSLTVERWRVPPEPAEGSPERLRLWAELLTGLELVDGGSVRPLGEMELTQRRDRFAELGGRLE